MATPQARSRHEQGGRLPRQIPAGWQRSLYAFLAEKQRRSGSMRTVESYSRMLQHFFGRVGKTPEQVASQDVFTWAYGIGISGKQPVPITIAARIACLSSFYHFLIRMKVVAANPCDALERPKTPESTPRGLCADGIRRLLDVMPNTPVGLRDRAIILTLTFTGRRRAEVMGMTAGSISVESGTVFYGYRGKGGKTWRRELPQPAFEAICDWLAVSGRSLDTMDAAESLWPNLRTGKAISSHVFYTDLRGHLKAARLPHGGVHIFRHSAAKLRRTQARR